MIPFPISHEGHRTTIHLPHTVDAHNARALVETASHLVQRQVLQLDLDMTETRRITASGVGAIVYLYESTRGRDTSLALINVDVGPRYTLSRMNIDRRLPPMIARPPHRTRPLLSPLPTGVFAAAPI
ncbi:MAG: STAS domain-containing protein [Myxococcota bacterium]